MSDLAQFCSQFCACCWESSWNDHSSNYVRGHVSCSRHIIVAVIVSRPDFIPFICSSNIFEIEKGKNSEKRLFPTITLNSFIFFLPETFYFSSKSLPT